MSSEDNGANRRTVLKKGAVAATVASGGLAASSGSATAADGYYLRVQGEGTYQIQVYADDWEVVKNGVSLEIESATDGAGNDYFVISGRVNGEINADPNDYAQFKIYNQEKFDTRAWDGNVDVYWKGDPISQTH